MATAASFPEPAMLPALPADYNWHCAGCNAVVASHFCTDCDETMPVYAWEEGVRAAYLPGSTFKGHPERIEAAERETNAVAGWELRNGRYREIVARGCVLDGLPISVAEAAILRRAA